MVMRAIHHIPSGQKAEWAQTYYVVLPLVVIARRMSREAVKLSASYLADVAVKLSASYLADVAVKLSASYLLEVPQSMSSR